MDSQMILLVAVLIGLLAGIAWLLLSHSRLAAEIRDLRANLSPQAKTELSAVEAVLVPLATSLLPGLKAAAMATKPAQAVLAYLASKGISLEQVVASLIAGWHEAVGVSPTTATPPAAAAAEPAPTPPVAPKPPVVTPGDPGAPAAGTQPPAAGS